MGQKHSPEEPDRFRGEPPEIHALRRQAGHQLEGSAGILVPDRLHQHAESLGVGKTESARHTGHVHDTVAERCNLFQQRQ